MAPNGGKPCCRRRRCLEALFEHRTVWRAISIDRIFFPDALIIIPGDVVGWQAYSTIIYLTFVTFEIVRLVCATLSARETGGECLFFETPSFLSLAVR